jgi:hypothetical protein
MSRKSITSILEQSRIKLQKIIEEAELLDAGVSVRTDPLTPEQAIGKQVRRDFPIIIGKEKVIEAKVCGAKGHAFTDSPREFSGVIKNVLDLPLTTNENRAILLATMNAVLRYLDLAEGTVHCKDEDTELCAKEIASHMMSKWGKAAIGLVGMNPAIAEMLAATFDAGNVKITDLNRDNVDSMKYGIEVWDGNDRTEDLVKQSDVILVTGSTLANGTFDHIWKHIRDHKRDYLVYGVTCAGTSSLMGLNRICPYGRNE